MNFFVILSLLVSVALANKDLLRRLSENEETIPIVESLVVFGENGAEYGLDYIDPGLYILTKDTYLSFFFTTGEGVIVVDAPPVFIDNGLSIIDIISKYTNEEIIYVIYSHHHLDHVGGAKEFDEILDNNIKYICHKDVDRRISQSDKLKNTIKNCDIIIRKDDQSWDKKENNYDRKHDCIEENGILKVGYQKINLDYWGTIPVEGNLWIYSKQHSFLSVVDFVAGGFIPFKYFSLAMNPSKFIDSHYIALQEYDFEIYVGGHRTINGRKDIELSLSYVIDLYEAAEKAIVTADVNSASGNDAWEWMASRDDILSSKCVEILNTEYNDVVDHEWRSLLGTNSQYFKDNCYWAIIDSLVVL